MKNFERIWNAIITISPNSYQFDFDEVAAPIVGKHLTGNCEFVYDNEDRALSSIWLSHMDRHIGVKVVEVDYIYENTKDYNESSFLDSDLAILADIMEEIAKANLSLKANKNKVITEILEKIDRTEVTIEQMGDEFILVSEGGHTEEDGFDSHDEAMGYIKDNPELYVYVESFNIGRNEYEVTQQQVISEQEVSHITLQKGEDEATFEVTAIKEMGKRTTLQSVVLVDASPKLRHGEILEMEKHLRQQIESKL